MNKKKTIYIEYRKYPRGIVYEDGYEALNIVGGGWLNRDEKEGVRLHVPYKIKDNVLAEYYDKRTFILLGTLYWNNEDLNYILEFPKVFNLENVTFKTTLPIKSYIANILRERGYIVEYSN